MRKLLLSMAILSTALLGGCDDSPPGNANGPSLHDEILAAIKAATPKDPDAESTVADHAVGTPILAPAHASTAPLLPEVKVEWVATASQRWTLVFPGPTQVGTTAMIHGYKSLDHCRKAAEQMFDTVTGAPFKIPAFCAREEDADGDTPGAAAKLRAQSTVVGAAPASAASAAGHWN